MILASNQMRRALAIMQVLMLSVASTVAVADIYKCTHADGEIEYRNMPCEAGDHQEVGPEKQPTIIPSLHGERQRRTSATAETEKHENRESSGSAIPEKIFSAVQRIKASVQDFTNGWSPSGVQIVLLVYVLMSTFSFFTYRYDKQASQKKYTRRVPENTLHLQEWLGGWPGAFIAQKVFRHKTVKPDYQFMFWCIVIVHGLVWIDWALGFPVLGGLFSSLS